MLGDSATTVVVIIIVTVILFVFPLMTMADQTDKATQLQAQTIVTNFVDEVKKTGVITQEDYDNLITELSALGEVYDVAITVQKVDGNSSKKQNASYVTIGDNRYIVMYNTQVTESFPLYLSEGDIIVTTADKISFSISDELRNAVYRVTGSDQNAKRLEASGMVTTTATNN